MANWLLVHNWQAFKRSPDFQRKLVVNIVFGILVLFLVFQFLLLGIFLNRMISEDISPGADPVEVVNGIFLYYFCIDFILRLILQKLHSVEGRAYLLLPVSRSSIARFILLKTPVTLMNFFPLLVIVPFFFNGVLASHPLPASLAWLVTVLSLMMWNTYVANYVKIRLITHPARTIPFVLILAALILLEKSGLVSFTAFSARLFGTVLDSPLPAAVPLLAAACALFVNYRFLTGHLYLDDIVKEKREKTAGEGLRFLSGMGTIGSLVSLDLRLMLRNKRARMTLWMPFLFIFYGLFFYNLEHIGSGNTESDFMLVFAGTFVTGFFIMSYGISTFCYESNYFSFLLTRQIGIGTYLKSRYYLMAAMTTVCYLGSVFYVVYGFRILLVNTAMFLFNIGFASYLFLFLSTFNKTRFDLGADAFSMQGKGSNQFTAVFLYLLVLLAIYLPVTLLAGSRAAFVALGAIGLAGILFHPFILRLLSRQFIKRRYIMSEGFRQQ
jgi:hypothetical protein